MAHWSLQWRRSSATARRDSRHTLVRRHSAETHVNQTTQRRQRANATESTSNSASQHHCSDAERRWRTGRTRDGRSCAQSRRRRHHTVVCDRSVCCSLCVLTCPCCRSVWSWAPVAAAGVAKCCRMIVSVGQRGVHVASSPPPCCVSPPLYPLHTSALALSRIAAAAARCTVLSMQ
jgi:hypothetical protein